MKIVKQRAKLVAITNLDTIENAGRLCYKSSPKSYNDCDYCDGSGEIDNDGVHIPYRCPKCKKRSTEEFVKKLIKSGHESVIEHSSATFHLITDRGVSHQIVRHRIASYSQESTRYCNYGKDGEISVIKPNLSSIIQESIWKKSISQSEKSYIDLIASGVKPEDARSVLPTCLKTELFHTANFREWRHILNIRGVGNAPHNMIKELSKLIYNEFNKIGYGLLFDDIDL